MKEKEKIQQKNKMSLIAFLFFCGGLITGGMIERIDTNNKIKDNYQENARIVYQGEEYPISNLYQLTKMDESHVCLLDSDIYYDIQNGEITSIKGYEEAFGYDVIHLIEFFPYEEFGNAVDTDGIQKRFNTMTQGTHKETTLCKIKARENTVK